MPRVAKPKPDRLPLRDQALSPRPAEPLQAYLSRCWQHTAQAALAPPRLFAS